MYLIDADNCCILQTDGFAFSAIFNHYNGYLCMHQGFSDVILCGETWEIEGQKYLNYSFLLPSNSTLFNIAKIQLKVT